MPKWPGNRDCESLGIGIYPPLCPTLAAVAAAGADVADAAAEETAVAAASVTLLRYALPWFRVSARPDWKLKIWRSTLITMYRVSHPIVHEILPCFVLRVPLPCLGSS